jgi:hypothetical protein
MIGFGFLDVVGGNWFQGQRRLRKITFSFLAGFYVVTLIGMALGLTGILTNYFLIASELGVLMLFALLRSRIPEKSLSDLVRKPFALLRDSEFMLVIIVLGSLTLFSATFTLPFGPYASDTFRVSIIANSIVSRQTIDFGNGILGLTEFDPYSHTIGSPLLIAMTYLHGINTSIAYSNLAGSLWASFLIALIAYEIASNWFRSSELSENARIWACLLFSTTFAFSELLLKFTGWTVMARTFVFILIPAYYLFVLSIKQSGPGIKTIILLALISIYNTFFHFTTAFTFVILFMYILVSRHQNRNWIKSIRIAYLMTIILLIELTVPLVLYALGNNALVWPWMVSRDLNEIIDFTSTQGTLDIYSVISAFAIWFSIRLGWLLPLAIIGYFGHLLRFQSMDDAQRKMLTISIGSVLALGFLMYRGMYFYQAVSIFFMVFAFGAITAIKYVFSHKPLRKVFAKTGYINIGTWFQNRRTAVYLFLLFIILIPSTAVEGYRVVREVDVHYDTIYVKPELVDITDYLLLQDYGDVILADGHIASTQTSMLMGCPVIPTDHRTLSAYGFDLPSLAINWPSSVNDLYFFVAQPLVGVEKPEIIAAWEYLLESDMSDPIVREYIAEYSIHYALISVQRPSSYPFFDFLIDYYIPEYSNAEYAVYRIG